MADSGTSYRQNHLTPAQQFLTCGQNHELLHSQLVAGMAATVDDVEGWHWQHQSLVAGQISQVLVQGNSLPSEKNKTKQDRVN